MQSGGSATWSSHQQQLILLLQEKIYKLLRNLNVVEHEWLSGFIHYKTGLTKVTPDNLDTIMNSLSFNDLALINYHQKLNLIKRDVSPNMNIDKINQYISDEQLFLGYSFMIGDKIYNHNSDNIYWIFSVDKVFTGILVILMIHNGIINEKDLFEPIGLDKEVIEQLSSDVIKRLRTTTFLDVMTHNAGLLDYLSKYGEALKDNENIKTPIEPEDFLKYADTDVSDDYQIYSNLGLLLVQLAVKHYYNKKFSSNLSYNDILYQYVINVVKLPSFSTFKPKNATYTHNDNVVAQKSKIGYWMSSSDLLRFGIWLRELCMDDDIYKLIRQYGTEFYGGAVDNAIHHGGSFESYGDATFIVYLDRKLIISMLSDMPDATNTLFNAMMIFN